MDTRAPWERTREWASEWVWTISFWTVATLSAVAALFLGLAITGDWSAAAGWAVVGTPVGVGLAVLARWITMPWRDLKEVRAVVAQRANMPMEQPGREDLVNSLSRYVEDRCLALEQIKEEFKNAEGAIRVRRLWAEVFAEASKAVRGVGTYDSQLGQYVLAEFKRANDEVKQWPDADYAVKETDAVIGALREAVQLYSR